MYSRDYHQKMSLFQIMAKITVSSCRLEARMPASQAGDRGSSPRESSCPHCHEPFPGDEIDSGDFTVCISCREIIRFNHQLQLTELEEQDWLDLLEEKDLFVAMLRCRMRILADQLRAKRHA